MYMHNVYNERISARIDVLRADANYLNGWHRPHRCFSGRHVRKHRFGSNLIPHMRAKQTDTQFWQHKVMMHEVARSLTQSSALHSMPHAPSVFTWQTSPYESNLRNAQYKVRNRPMCFQFRWRHLSWGLLLEPRHKHGWPVPDSVLSVSWIAKLDSYGLVC